jgi:hypothetical protein
MVNYLKVVKLSSCGKYLDKLGNLLEEHIFNKGNIMWSTRKLAVYILS